MMGQESGGSMTDTCCMMCCPSPKMAQIRPQGLAGTMRKYVKYCIYADVVVCILQMMTFTIQEGFFQAIAIWITFMAYSTMGFC